MAETITSGPSALDWNIYAGDSNEERFEFLTSDDPWDITGCAIEAQARVTALDPVAALTATVTITDAVNGQVTVGWDGEAVRALLAGTDSWTGVWDLQITEVDALLPRTLLRGVMTARMDVTRVSVSP
jgi:hypothetical protein